MQLQGGTLLHGGSYRIIETLGRGGFGVTYLAEQVSLHRRVCIKEFFPKDYYKRDGDTGALTLSSDGFGEMMGKFKAKFVKEAQTIATLNHANIIPIHDVFEENNTCYYVMEYIEGESLSSIIKGSGALSEDVAVGYIKQVASALEHIHEQQIMHLDVKPGNIMVRSKDNRAILIDFGLSKHYDATSGEATSTTPVGVSHGYAPMEQYKQGGVNRFSPETDIYSLGATLYYLVTGNVPPQAADIPEEGIVFPTDMSSNIRETIAKSMSYLRKDRPHTIEEFLELLDSKTATPIVPVVANEKTTLDSDNNIASEQKSTPKPAEQKKPTEQKQTPKATPTEKKAAEPKAAPAEKKAAEPKKEWTPKYGVNKPKTSENETSKKRKSLWWLWLLILLLIGGVAYLMFMGGDNAAPISNTTNTAKPHLDTFEQIDSDSITLNQPCQDSTNMDTRDDATTKDELELIERDSTDWANAAAEQKKREEEAARQAEQQRLVEEEAERQRIAEQKKKEEAARQAEQQHIAEQKKREDEAARKAKAEQQRIDNMVAQSLGRDGVYQIGDYYNVNGKQGVVFEVWDNGRHGKIVSLDEAYLQWCTDEQYKERIKLGLTDENNGKANTDKVMQRRDSDQYPAFVWCRNKGDDWYLPAMEELEAIYNNKSAINSTLAEYGAQLTNGWYWSLTEYKDNPKICAWLVLMFGGNPGYNYKGGYNHVRAVSAF